MIYLDAVVARLDSCTVTVTVMVKVMVKVLVTFSSDIAAVGRRWVEFAGNVGIRMYKVCIDIYICIFRSSHT